MGLEWDLHPKFTPKIILNYSIFFYLWTHTAPPSLQHMSTCALFHKVNTNILGSGSTLLVFFSAGGESSFMTANLTLCFHSHKKKLIRICIKLRENLEHMWSLHSSVINDNGFTDFNGCKINFQGKWSFIYVRGHKRELFFFTYLFVFVWKT